MMQYTSGGDGQLVFDDFVLGRDGLTRAGEWLAIPPKELGVLRALLEADGALVSKESLLDQAWGVDTVSEASLTRCIYALRRLLKQGQSGRYIDSIYGRGYRFNCPVSFVPPNAQSPSHAR